MNSPSCQRLPILPRLHLIEGGMDRPMLEGMGPLPPPVWEDIAVLGTELP